MHNTWEETDDGYSRAATEGILRIRPTESHVLPEEKAKIEVSNQARLKAALRILHECVENHYQQALKQLTPQDRAKMIEDNDAFLAAQRACVAEHKPSYAIITRRLESTNFAQEEKYISDLIHYEVNDEEDIELQRAIQEVNDEEDIELQRAIQESYARPDETKMTYEETIQRQEQKDLNDAISASLQPQHMR